MCGLSFAANGDAVQFGMDGPVSPSLSVHQAGFIFLMSARKVTQYGVGRACLSGGQRLLHVSPPQNTHTHTMKTHFKSSILCVFPGCTGVYQSEQGLIGGLHGERAANRPFPAAVGGFRLSLA